SAPICVASLWATLRVRLLSSAQPRQASAIKSAPAALAPALVQVRTTHATTIAVTPITAIARKNKPCEREGHDVLQIAQKARGGAGSLPQPEREQHRRDNASARYP